MKGYTVIIIIAVTVVTSTLLYVQKFKGKPDAMAKALDASRIVSSLPVSAQIGFKTEPGNDELYTKARCILAPRYLSIDPKERFDTTLIIQFSKGSDTNLISFIGSQQVLVQYADSNNIYTLTRKH